MSEVNVFWDTLFMPVKAEASKEWIDGFLFVGNQLALDFLNTKLILAGETKEMLPDTEALGRWLMAAGVVSTQKQKHRARKWVGTRKAEGFLKDLLAFRERLRAVVVRRESGSPVSDGFVAEVNSLLERHPSVIAVRRKGGELDKEVVFEPANPEDVWAPIAMAVAELLSDVPARRVRKCESCIVQYYDSSKKGSRRWCSMSICGNKVKVAAYQRRNRMAGE
jgi:predicted RNA-binding Zn ribbon-like protein